ALEDLVHEVRCATPELREVDVGLEPDQLGRQGGQPVIVPIRPSRFDDEVLALDVAEVTESLPQGLELARVAGGRRDAEEADTRHPGVGAWAAGRGSARAQEER